MQAFPEDTETNPRRCYDPNACDSCHSCGHLPLKGKVLEAGCCTVLCLDMKCPCELIMSKHLVPAGDIVLEGCRTFRRQSLSGKKSLRVGLEALQPGITSCLLSVPLGKCLCVFMCMFLCVIINVHMCMWVHVSMHAHVEVRGQH